MSFSVSAVKISAGAWPLWKCWGRGGRRPRALSSWASDFSEKAPVAYSRKIVWTIGARSGSGSTQRRATLPFSRISRRRT
ncbi:MAG: hypothetical protein H0W96_02300 [Solirubrobacterales bacterium]|nr:hypothetical protein [Solirubrobacterales bacterium]